MLKRLLGVVTTGLLVCGCTASATPNAGPTRPVRPSFAVRPVLCWAPNYESTAVGGPGTQSGVPTCSPSYQLSASNLAVTPDSSTAIGYTSNASIAPDPALASYPTTTPAEDDPLTTVILPASSSASNPQHVRFVLGPTALTATSVKEVDVLSQNGQWLVDVMLTPAGAATWDALASTHFHTFLAVVVNGSVVSAAVTEPIEASFISYGGQVEISGEFTQEQAKALAAQI